jgi:hypothetical protein
MAGSRGGRRWLRCWPAATLTLVCVLGGLLLRAATVSASVTSYAATALTLSPAPSLQALLPQGSTGTIVATPIGKVPADARVTFSVRGANSAGGTAQLDAKLPAYTNTRSATFAYTDIAGTGTDTVTATLATGTQTLATGTTTVEWVPPATCTDTGLPSLFRPQSCNAAKNLLATVLDTGGCLLAFEGAGRLKTAVQGALKTGHVPEAIGSNTPIGELAADLVGLTKHRVTTKDFASTVYHASEVKDVITGVADLVQAAKEHGAPDKELGEIALATTRIAGFGPCIDLVQNTTRTAPVPVLGIPGLMGPQGKGWGEAHPSVIFNGGDPSSYVTSISWTQWGSPTSIGTGLAIIARRSGGYYSGRYRIDLKATRLGHCSPSGPLVYEQLWSNQPHHPGGPLTGWTLWAESLCSL